MENIKDLPYLDKKKIFSERMLMTEKSYAKALNHSIMSNTDKDRIKLKRYKKMCYDSNLPVMYYDIPQNCKSNVKDIYTNGIQINANISFWVKHTPQAKQFLSQFNKRLKEFEKTYRYMLKPNSECIIENTRCRFTMLPEFSLIFPKLLCFVLVDFMCAVKEPNASELLSGQLKSLHTNKKFCNQ